MNSSTCMPVVVQLCVCVRVAKMSWFTVYSELFQKSMRVGGRPLSLFITTVISKSHSKFLRKSVKIIMMKFEV